MARPKKRVRKQLSQWSEAILIRFEKAVMAYDRLPDLTATDEESAQKEMEAMQPPPFMALWQNRAANGVSLSMSGTAIDAFLLSQGVGPGHRKFLELNSACRVLLQSLAEAVLVMGDKLEGREPAPFTVSYR